METAKFRIDNAAQEVEEEEPQFGLPMKTTIKKNRVKSRK